MTSYLLPNGSLSGPHVVEIGSARPCGGAPEGYLCESRAGDASGMAQWAAEHALPTALQDLEPQQLLLFVQSFGIPVSSMSKLLQYLDQAVAQDPQTLEQNIMDKSKKSWGPTGLNLYAC